MPSSAASFRASGEILSRPGGAGATGGGGGTTGDGAGGGAWHIQVANQKLTVFEGQAPNPSLSVDMPASDFVLMMHGQLNPMSEFMSGKLKLRGDMSLAMQLLSWFKPK